MKIIIASSGSGGHFFPALSFAQKLRQKNFEVFLVTDQVARGEDLAQNVISVQKIPATKINLSSPAAFFKAIINLLKSFSASLSILKRVKPAVVVGFGGYASFPLVVAAGFMRVPAVIHEQNVIAGRANRICALFAKKIALSFAETEKYFNPKKTVLTGCPVRVELFAFNKEESLKKFNFQPGRFTILAMGGGQGSHRINEAFVEAVSRLAGSLKLQVIHITGQKDFEYIKNAYSKMAVSSCCVAFLKEMGYAYNIADLVISRAGASSLAEIARFRIPSILIPYPFAYNHQMANASVFKRLGTAIIIEDKDLSAVKLAEIILHFLNEPAALQAMKNNFDKITIPDAAESLLELVMSLNQNA